MQACLVLRVCVCVCVVSRHQAGWLPFNLDNELQDLAEPANHNQDEPNADNRNNTVLIISIYRY